MIKFYLENGRVDDGGKGKEILLENGAYHLTSWNDDLVNKSNGYYFLNENKNRKTLTLTLVPDLAYSGSDTVLLECQNIDIIELTEQIMIAKKPTRWLVRDNRRLIETQTMVFKKVK